MVFPLSCYYTHFPPPPQAPKAFFPENQTPSPRKGRAQVSLLHGGLEQQGLHLPLHRQALEALSEITGEAGSCAPAKDCGLRQGDIITHINDTQVDTIEQVQSVLQGLEGDRMSIRAIRGDKQMQLTAQAVKCSTDGAYKLGAWIRDSMAGIGTLTFYDPETGETLDQIVCYGNDGGTLSVEDGIDLSQIRGGDVIRFSKGQGQIKKLEKIYDYESGAKTGAADPGGTSTVLGYVYYKDAPYIRVSTVNPAEETVTEDNLLLYKADAFTAYLYDGTLKEPEVVTTNVSEMLDYYHAGEDCAKVLIATRNNDPTTLIVIR